MKLLGPRVDIRLNFKQWFSGCDSWTTGAMAGGLQGQNQFCDNTNMVFAFFLTLVVMVQKHCWVKNEWSLTSSHCIT